MTVVGTGTAAGAPVSVTPKIAAPPAPSAAVLGNSKSRAPAPAPSPAPAPVTPSSAPAPPSMENERMLYTYRVDKPEAAGTFVISPLQLSPLRAQGMPFSILHAACIGKHCPGLRGHRRGAHRFLQ